MFSIKPGDSPNRKADAETDGRALKPHVSLVGYPTETRSLQKAESADVGICCLLDVAQEMTAP